MRFKDRVDAGRRLAQALIAYQNNKAAIVLALPRGGVVLGVEVAKVLGLPLDLVIPRKVGHPMQPEYAIAAVAESGQLATNPGEVERVDPDWFRQAVERERREASRRRELYLGGRAMPALAGKTAIIVDDGIATGLTMFAAIRDVRHAGAARIVVAVPAAPAETVARLQREVDEVVTLDNDEYYLGAVGAYYDDFQQVTDTEVIELLKPANEEVRG